ncbi:BnaC09g54610D [Brassica napus]|uniref:(rape) hypothetical protein n=1 Tax=Brassica napus TaxID=3708 RepID=A0A078J671_BRANA|nr:unnamed protein product [Brassica napus]CDY58416.1 BnaC09g54610D [Brassica napus]
MMYPAPKLLEKVSMVETNTKKATKFWLAVLFQDHIKNKLEAPYRHEATVVVTLHGIGVAIRNYIHLSSQVLQFDLELSFYT